jgi:hypothetical protein
MTERKFTPPTEFPAEYVTGGGHKAVVLGRAPVGDYPFVGYVLYGKDGSGWPECWTEKGSMFTIEEASEGDLHDIPKRITTWHNVYDNWLGPQCSSRNDADDIDNSLKSALNPVRLCVYRIERDEDCSNPEIFVEKV